MSAIASLSTCAAVVAEQPASNTTGSAPVESTRSSEEMLSKLQTLRPTNEVIPPASASFPAEPDEQLMLPEGWYIIEQTGYLVQEGENWSFVVEGESAEKTKRIKCLPNATLEVMTRAGRDAHGRLRFTVSGIVTVFERENYLLPKSAVRAHQPEAKSPESAINVAASPEDVTEWMKKQSPEDRVLPSATPSGAPPGASANSPPVNRLSTARAVLAEGAPIIHQTGRLVRSGAWWQFVPESEDAESLKSPMKILPSKTLELMAAIAQRDPTGLSFSVSGEVTVFRGENYLWPKIAIRRIDGGNLTK